MSAEMRPEEERDPIAEEEAEAAEAEAARIGGDVPPDTDDPAEQPLIEGGEGVAEGFELAEEDLEDIASHGDQHRFPGRLAGQPEEPTEATYGEADQEIDEDADEAIRKDE
jgi:hypothetical protein